MHNHPPHRGLRPGRPWSCRASTSARRPLRTRAERGRAGQIGMGRTKVPHNMRVCHAKEENPRGTSGRGWHPPRPDLPRPHARPRPAPRTRLEQGAAAAAGVAHVLGGKAHVQDAKPARPQPHLRAGGRAGGRAGRRAQVQWGTRSGRRDFGVRSGARQWRFALLPPSAPSGTKLLVSSRTSSNPYPWPRVEPP